MKIVKKINNNYAIGIDGNGSSVIVYGKGIGFPQIPYELDDLEKIEQSYYNVDSRFISLISSLPESILVASSKIVNYAEKNLGKRLNPNLVFTLADHLDYTIKRIRKGITFNYHISYEIRYNHPEELEVARKCCKYLERIYEDIKLPQDEVAVIAMHLYEAEEVQPSNSQKSEQTDKIIQDIVTIVEQQMDIKLDKGSFDYYRFATHMQYLLDRKKLGKEISTDNKKLFESMIKECPKTYQCILKIKDYFVGKQYFNLGEEELLYLMIHINRLSIKEDCNH